MVDEWRGPALRFVYTALAIADVLQQPIDMTNKKAGANRRLVYSIDGNKCKLSFEAPPNIVEAVAKAIEQAYFKKGETGENPIDEALPQVAQVTAVPPVPGLTVDSKGD
jgi:hypothetical protein